MIKSFSLNEEEAYILEREAKREGLSQSEFIRKLLSNTESGLQKKRGEKIEALFAKILKIYEQINSQNKMLTKTLKYLIETDEIKREKIVQRAKSRKDYDLLDFLLE